MVSALCYNAYRVISTIGGRRTICQWIRWHCCHLCHDGMGNAFMSACVTTPKQPNPKNKLKWLVQSYLNWTTKSILYQTQYAYHVCSISYQRWAGNLQHFDLFWPILTLTKRWPRSFGGGERIEKAVLNPTVCLLWNISHQNGKDQNSGCAWSFSLKN